MLQTQVTYAEWQLGDADGIVVLETEELDASAHSSPSIDSMALFCLASLGEGLAKRDLPPVAYWQMSFDVMREPHGPGSCGELRVWTTFEQL